MSYPHNFQQTKKTITSHMQNILNNINSRLSTSTKKLHNFNTKLNKFLAHAPSNHLQPHQTTFPLNIFIQNSNESVHMHQSCLSTAYQHDTFKFNSSSSQRTHTFTSKTTNRYLPISKHISSNEYKQTFSNYISSQNKRQTHYKPNFIYTKNNYLALHISLFYYFEKITSIQLSTDSHKTTMPPSPVNLPFSSKGTSLVLSPLTKKASPFKPIIPPTSTSDEPVVSPAKLGVSLLPDHNATSEKPTTIHDTIPIEAPKFNYAESISNLPASITYSADTIFVLCQLRRGQDDSINNELARLHNDGSAPNFLETLITASFLARPTTSTLHSHLRIRDIKYESMRNLTPTYSISFGTLLKSDGNEPTYARHGSPRFTELRAYINDFVFERWHTKDELDLETYQDVLKAIYFTLPPCNYPKHKPIAFVAGLPPQVFGRKTFHTQIIISHLHTLLKPLLPSASPLHNYCYFLQSFGLQVRRNYTFKEGLQEDVYVACVSNTADHRLLANILFPSSDNNNPQLPILNLPVTFIPLPTRPPKTAKVALSRYYQTITTIATTIRTQRTMLQTLPFITTPIFKDPAAATTCKLILDNENTITYAILHSIHNGIHTRIYVKNQNIIASKTDDTIRSWFNPSDHTKLFFPKATQHPPQISRSPTMIDSIVQNLETSISLYAKAIGYQPPPTQASKEHNNASTTNHETNDSTNKSTTNEHMQTPVIPLIPTTKHNPIIISPATSNNPPNIPLITILDKPSLLTPRKRQAARSPSPQSDTTSNASSPPSPVIKKEPNTNQMDASKATTPDPSPATDEDTAPISSIETQDLPSSYSIRIDGIATTLRNSLPSTKQPFIDDEEVTNKALTVYESTNHNDAILQAKKDLLLLAETKILEYRAMRAKKKSKVRSSKKKKKSLKEANPYFT